MNEPNKDFDVILAQCLNLIDEGKAEAIEALIANHPRHASQLHAYLAQVSSIDRRLDDTAPNSRGLKSQVALDLPKEFGKYRLLEHIGAGAMGEVFRACDPGLNRSVALKVIRAHRTSARDLDRFVLEAQTAAKLLHPNIVQIHEVGEVDDQPFFTMDCIDGFDLKQLADGTGMSPKVAASYIARIARATHFAHEQGVVHRDIKPSNILIEKSTDRPLITDFGLAKNLIEPADLTMTNEVVGSPAYLAPEIISGKSVTSGQADIYSLGATLYHLLAGIPPFGGDSVATILKNAMIGDIPPVRSVRRSIPRDLETICGKSMEKAPGKRYATAQEMAEDLERYLRGEPIVARPIGRLEKSWRWCQKRPAQAALLALGALVMVASTVTAIYINGLRLEAERNAAESDELHHFLTDVLRSPDPSVDGREITIAERLEYSLGAVDSQLADQPRRRAAILTTIGRTFFGLGLYDKAVESLEFAEAIYEDLPDSKPRDLLYCRNFLAMSRSSLGVSEKDILADLQQIKQAWQMNPGTMDHRYLEILEASGNCYLRQSMFQEALSEFRVAVELSSSINGKDSIETIGCRQQYGRVLVELSRFDEAIAMFENDLALLKSLGLDGALEEMHLLGSLAQALRLNGQASRAFDIQDRAYNISVAQLGEDHPVTLLRMQSLALLYLSHPENKSHAHELFSRRYELCKSTFGENHPTTLGAQSQLGLGLDGSDPEVEKRLIENLEDLIPRMKKHIGSENKMTLAAQQNLASMLARKSRTVTGDERTKCVEEAAAIFEEISPVAREVFGENGRNRCYIDRGFATILEYQNKLAEAAKLRQSLIPGLASNYGKQHPRSYREFYSAIALFCRAEEFDECQSLARKFVDEYASHSDGVELYLVMCHSILADIYVRKGQVELAETALQAVFEIEQQHKDLIGRYTMGYTNAIKARCAMECDDAELAAERLRLADELMSPLPEGPPPIIQWRISQFAKWGEELRDRIGKQ